MTNKLYEKNKIENVSTLRQKIQPLYLPLCFLSFIIMDISFRYIYDFLFTTDLFSYYPTMFTIFWSLLLTSVIGLIPGLAKRITMMIIILIFGIFNIAHGIGYNIFNNFFSFADLVYLGNGIRFFSLTYLNLRKLLIISVLFSVSMMAFAAWLSAAGGRPKVNAKNNDKANDKANDKVNAKRRTEVFSYLSAAVLSACGILIMHSTLMDLGASTQMSWRTAIAEDPESVIYADFTDVNHSVGVAGIYQFTVRDFLLSSGLEQWIENASVHSELDAEYAKREGMYNIENDMTGIFEGKNLIYIMLESIDTWMIEEEYMPELYALQQKSINFVNHYSPLFINAGTFNTEFTSLTGQLTPTSGTLKSTYTDNCFLWSLPSLFREKGYSANSFHSAEPVIYNRGTIHRAIGFEDYYCWYNLGMVNYMKDSQLVNGFNKMVAEKPFFSFIITYSGHGPYTEEMAAISEPHYQKAVEAANRKGIVGEDKNSMEYYHAIAHAMETDAFIGGLLDKLEESGLIEDTVIILFSDHYAKYMTDTEYLYRIKGVNNTDLLCNTPFMIYSSDVEPREISTLTSTIDIFPTVVNMFGLNADLKYFEGHDIFGENHPGYVMFRNYSWFDGEVYYSADYEGQITNEISERTAEVMRRVNRSWDSLKSDYFRNLICKK